MNLTRALPSIFIILGGIGMPTLDGLEAQESPPPVDMEIQIIGDNDKPLTDAAEDLEIGGQMDAVESAGEGDEIIIDQKDPLREPAPDDDDTAPEVVIDDKAPIAEPLDQEEDGIVIDGTTGDAVDIGPAVVIDEEEEPSPESADQEEKTSAAEIAARESSWTRFTGLDTGNFTLGLDETRLEYGRVVDSDSDADTSNYAHLAFSAHWKPDSPWETKLSGRLDGYYQTGDPDTDQLELDYGESFVRYHANSFRLTAGTQKVIWGRVDELPPTDRISRVDASRGVLDPLPERRRAMPVIRFEGFHEDYKLDGLWKPYFRRARLPNKNNIWSLVNQQSGEVFGIKSNPLIRQFVKAGTVSNRTPSGNGGFGTRLSHSGDRLDYAVTIQRARQSLPYYEFNPEVRAAFLAGADIDGAIASTGKATFQARYPRTWVLGGDLGFEALNATWRFEAVWTSDAPATRSDLRYKTVNGANWATGVQFHPGDGEVRVNLQVWGNHLINASGVLDQRNTYNFNGSVEGQFANNRWRAKTRFFFGLDQKDIYINPEIAFIGWEPHEVYLAVHYFDGNDGTLGGFYDDNSLLTLGWRAKF